MNSAKILIVDDKPDNIYVIQQLLVEYLPDCQILSAKNAMEGLQIAETAPPDVALIDVQLPIMNGIDMCQYLKANEKTSHFPILLLTAHKSTAEFRAEGLLAGADDFISKPIDNIELVAKIKAMLRIKRAEDQLRQTNENLENLVLERSKALQASEAKLRKILENLNEGIWVIDQDATTTFVNPFIAGMLQYTPEEMLGKSLFSFMNEEGITLCKEILERRRKGVAEEHDFIFTRKDGNAIFTSINTSPFTDADGNYTGAIVGVIDVSERKKIEDALQFLLQCGWPGSNEDFFNSLARYLSEKLNMEYVCIDRLLEDGCTAQTVSVFNQGQFECNVTYRLQDTPCGDVVGKTICCFPDAVCQLFPRDAVLQEMKAVSYVGTTLWSSEGKPIGLIAVIGNHPLENPHLAQSILQLAAGRAAGELERRHMVEALQISEERFRRLVNSITNYIYSVKVIEGKPAETFHSPGSIAVTGFSPEEFRADPYLWFRIIHEDDQPAVTEMAAKIIAGETVPPIEHRIWNKNGAIRWIRNITAVQHNAQGELIAYDGLIVDITEQRRLEEQLRQSQKMEAIGQIAGGIAHDFNNILGVIIGCMDLILINMPPGDENKQYINMTVQAAERAKNLVKQILTFSRKSTFEKRPLVLASLVKETVKMLRSSLPATIEIVQDIQCESAMILADSTQIHQVLMNLCTNAAHAMQESGGVLNITLAEISVDWNQIEYYHDMQPGLYICLTIRDTGHGIDPKNRERIFDPFFTTKDKHTGTGLGLSVALGIVKSHNGYITFDSTVGVGTVFNVFLPKIDETAEPEREKFHITKGRGEQILLVDDEAGLLQTGKRLLEALGYTVTAVQNGLEALALFRSMPNQFDLIMTDLTMPKMTGLQLASEIIQIRPEVPILLDTGYNETVNIEKAKEFGIRAMVMKPYRYEEISKVIRQVLDKPV